MTFICVTFYILAGFFFFFWWRNLPASDRSLIFPLNHLKKQKCKQGAGTVKLQRAQIKVAQWLARALVRHKKRALSVWNWLAESLHAKIKPGVVSLATAHVVGGLSPVLLAVALVFSERSLTFSPLIGWLSSGAISDAGKRLTGSSEWKKKHRGFSGKYLVLPQQAFLSRINEYFIAETIRRATRTSRETDRLLIGV